MKTRGRVKPSQDPQDRSDPSRHLPSRNTKAHSANTNNHYDGLQSDISIHLDTSHIMAGRDRSSTLGSFRDRGLTLGSEFDDLDLTLGLDNMNQAATAATAGAGNDPHHNSKRMRSSSHNTTASMDYLGILGQAASALAQHDTDVTNMPSLPLNSRSQSKISNPSSSKRNHQNPQRSKIMSEVQDRDVIMDKHDKGMVSGDGKKDELQYALDAYERGDTTALEGMMKSGSLNTKNRNDFDLLVDMDFDFMGMGAAGGGSSGGAHDPR